jgi:hypothetical protein
LNGLKTPIISASVEALIAIAAAWPDSLRRIEFLLHKMWDSHLRISNRDLIR